MSVIVSIVSWIQPIIVIVVGRSGNSFLLGRGAGKVSCHTVMLFMRSTALSATETETLIVLCARRYCRGIESFEGNITLLSWLWCQGVQSRKGKLV
jgi:hypothetical protein